MGNKRLIISEEQYNYLVSEMAYPATFNMDVFKSLPTFTKRIQYCESKLERISAYGSSRIVYKIDDEKVLKLAKNNKGVAQNECEASDYYKKSIECFAKIYDYDDNFLWVEMQLAKKVKPSDFNRIVGVSFKTVCDFILYCYNSYCRNGKQRPISSESKKYLKVNGFKNNWTITHYFLIYQNILVIINLK